MAVYLLGAIDRNNLDEYAKYEEGAFISVQKFGVEALAVSDNIRTIEGEAPAQRIILMKFQDQEALDRWYNSPEYQSVLPIRVANADSKFLVSFEGL